MLEVKGRWPVIDPEVNRSEFSKEEKIKAWKLYKEHGNSWYEIQANFPEYGGGLFSFEP